MNLALKYALKRYIKKANHFQECLSLSVTDAQIIWTEKSYDLKQILVNRKLVES